MYCINEMPVESISLKLECKINVWITFELLESSN